MLNSGFHDRVLLLGATDALMTFVDDAKYQVQSNEVNYNHLNAELEKKNLHALHQSTQNIKRWSDGKFVRKQVGFALSADSMVLCCGWTMVEPVGLHYWR